MSLLWIMSEDHVRATLLVARRASRNQKPSVAGWGWSACYQRRLEHMVPARACQVTLDGKSMTQHPQLGGSRIKDDLVKEDFNDSSIYHV
jgi:hypothetical protein